MNYYLSTIDQIILLVAKLLINEQPSNGYICLFGKRVYIYYYTLIPILFGIDLNWYSSNFTDFTEKKYFLIENITICLSSKCLN